MTQKPLYRSLDANLALLEEMFGRSDDFYTKRLMLAGIPCAIVMFTGLSSPEKLCRMALDMLDRDPAMLGGGEGLCERRFGGCCEALLRTGRNDRRRKRQCGAHRRARAARNSSARDEGGRESGCDGCDGSI